MPAHEGLTEQVKPHGAVKYQDVLRFQMRFNMVSSVKTDEGR